MTERASDLLSELSVRLTADLQEAGATASEAIRTSMPELVLTVPESFSEMPIRSSSQFLEALYRTLRIDSSVPWAEYYVLAREASHRYAEKGVPLESLMEAMAIFRRAVISRITGEVEGSPYADEVVLLAQSRLGDVLEHLNSSFIRGYLDYTEARHQARQTELHGLYHIASALGRSLDVTEIAEVGLSETLQVLNLQAGAAWVREGARLKLAKTLGLEPGQESEFSVSGRPGPLKVMEIATGPADVLGLEPLADKWRAFGWSTREIDGHDVVAIHEALTRVPFAIGRPSCLIAHTVKGFDDVARLGAQVTIFRLGTDPGLARFIDQVARRVEGRVVVPDLDGLGAAVVGDYLRSRRRR